MTEAGNPISPDGRKRARRAHRMVRGQHREERTEDYVEAVYRMERKGSSTRVVDLQRVFAVSHVTVIRAVEKLEAEGLLQRGASGIGLTRKGRILGLRCYERHRLVEQFLVSLGIPEETAARDAEGIEHHLSPETLQAMRDQIEKR